MSSINEDMDEIEPFKFVISLFNLLISYNKFYNLNMINEDMFEIFFDFIIKHS